METLRALWLKEGDSSTKFFHRVVVANKRRNYIELEVNGVTHVGNSFRYLSSLFLESGLIDEDVTHKI